MWRVGLGFRRDLVDFFGQKTLPHFVEFAPENWMNIGGRWGRALSQVVERYPVLLHGLSLSLGSPEPLDLELLSSIKRFIERTGAEVYSEHLSFSKCDNAHLYDLLPIPFCQEAVDHVVGRIRKVQDFLGRRIAIENVSYYTTIDPEMDELTFIRSVIEAADCDLLLDVNNVYVNAYNHGYDAKTFIDGLPLERVVYIHMAGHRDGEIKIDTHGEAVCEDVYDLLSYVVPKLNPLPVLLERDSNFPAFEDLEQEMERIHDICGAVA